MAIFKLVDLWAHDQFKVWLGKRGLAALDNKIKKLPISVNRSCVVCFRLLLPHSHVV